VARFQLDEKQHVLRKNVLEEHYQNSGPQTMLPLRGDEQLLTDLNLVWVGQFVSVGLEYLHVLARLSVIPDSVSPDLTV
jgi:hypothetical protein